jgi:predicted dehydrogenase
MGFFAIEEPVVSIEAVREGPPAPGGRATDVSVIWDLMIHDLDMAAKLIGEGASVAASGERRHSDYIDEASAQLAYADGRSATIGASRAADERKRAMTITYASGSITVDFLTRQVDNTTPHRVQLDISDTLPDPLGAADEAFFAACLGHADTPIPGRVAAEAVRLAELAEAAARKGH